jgi:hypothetical protein
MEKYFEIHQTNFGEYSIYIKLEDRSVWLDKLDITQTMTMVEMLDKLGFDDLSPIEDMGDIE